MFIFYERSVKRANITLNPYYRKELCFTEWREGRQKQIQLEFIATICPKAAGISKKENNTFLPLFLFTFKKQNKICSEITSGEINIQHYSIILGLREAFRITRKWPTLNIT